MDKYLAYLLLIYLCLHELNTLFKRVYLVLCKLPISQKQTIKIIHPYLYGTMRRLYCNAKACLS